MARPNIIFLHVDQLNPLAIGANGCRHASTPNMDRLIERGVSFRHSCATDPVCMPARTSWYTGLLAEEHGQLTNAPEYNIDPSLPDLGPLLRKGGYDSVYMGKWHVAKPAGESFDVQFNGHGYGEYGDAYTARAAEAFLAGRVGDKPFFLNIGLLNPHDICMWCFNPCGAGKFSLAGKMADDLPPLPPNHRVGMPDWTRGEWSDLDWRYYIYSYYRFTEMVDVVFRRVCDALANSRFADNTLLIFTADHGEGMTQHYFCGKGTSYDHCVIVPLVLVDPAVKEGRRDATHMVSGIDVTATICDYAGVDPLPGTRGLSLRPLVRGEDPAWRPYAPAAGMGGRQRLIRTPELKLINDRVTGEYTLYDLVNDPWEMTNVAREPDYAAAVTRLKKTMDEHEATLHYAPQMIKMIERWKEQGARPRKPRGARS
ncbi:MAG: sulfatase-like hydrolase/transferase [bacterium]|nr:sulfatase-like hydrolase/transferase [bacterium]